MFCVPLIWPNMSDYPIIDHSEKSVFDSCQFPRVKRGNLSMKKSWFFRFHWFQRYCVTMTCWCVLIFCLKISKVRETIIRVRLYTYIYVTNRILSGSCILYFFLFSYSVFKKKCQNQRFATILSICFKAKHCSNVILIHYTTELKYIVS